MKKICTVSAMMVLSLAMAFGQDAAAVSISVGSTDAAIVSVAAPTTSISGTASAVAGVARVTWQTSNGVTGTASGTTTWEAKDIPVAEGNTTVILRAYDSKGTSAWVALVTVRNSGTVVSSAAKLPQQPSL